MKSSIVIGLGKTGFSCINYLNSHSKHFIVFDTRANPPHLAEFKQKFPKIPLYLENLPVEKIENAEQIIVSPGVSLEEPVIKLALEKKIPVVGDVEIFARAAKAPIIGITGTNAKGTVTTLVGEMLKRANKSVIVGGNIGTPVLDLLQDPPPEYYVLELSSFQLDVTYALKTKAATILNISEDHLDRHKTMDAYIAAKQRIYQNCESVIWNREDKWTYPRSPQVPALSDNPKTYSFGLTKPADGEFGLAEQDNKIWLAQGDNFLMPVTDLLIQGRHNWSNALAALAIGHAVGLPFPPMIEALKSFKGLEHRCEWVLEKNGIRWYNDSKGTNLGAAIAAIEGLGSAGKGAIILIAGGLGKGADFTALREPVKKFVKTVILLGQDANLIESALGNDIDIQRVKTMEEAVLLAKEIAIKNEIVLLSPACASFDMFENYEHRGQIFKSLVKEIIA